MTNIRMARLQDSDSINALSLHLGYEIATQLVAEERLQCLIDSSNDDVWVFEDAGIILGWIHVYKAHRLASAAFFEIGGLVVTPEARNKGIGRQLVEFACEQAQNQNIALRVRCNAKRQDTHEFYERMGFITTKSQHVFEMYLGDD
ncbi:GCN5-related N-acetyltransferase [Moritella sp. JT01]|uniref:GNAT family N-acetyltransferase n=1 Tax=Moritella sp. JT01 TaxID=756698 RepID=UPI000793EEC5|nr:GNAT family N-acetyltransferase [Moritella sp. JT01]KXO09034.1 GCN5-related N-acetyltransferase [Moritella sp. JT01]